MTRVQPSTAVLAETVGRWQGRPVVVIGDVVLDEWRFTDPHRLIRESAAPVVRLNRRQDSPGGAANTAVNLAALGARPTLLGPVGPDDAGDLVRAGLARAGVDDATVTLPAGRTPRKCRIVAGDQILLCEEDAPPPGGVPAAGPSPLVAALERVLASGDRTPALVVCDYGTGALDDRVRSWLVAHRQSFGVIGLDAHDLGRWTDLAPTLITPSYREAWFALGASCRAGAATDRPTAAVEGACELLRRLGAEVAAVTLDVDGSVVVAADGAFHRTRTRPAAGSRTVGAGDVYLAAMTLAWAGGADLDVAAELAQRAAGASVEAPGTCVCTRAELLAALDAAPTPDDGVVDASQLAELVGRHRRRGARIVFTNGCFDVLHHGHVRYLAQARELGDVLIVAVNSDDSARRLKGPDRPVNAVEDRVAILAALACVSHVVVFDEDSPTRLLEAVRPDVYVKGGDYRPDLVPEAPLVARLGGEVRTLDYVPYRSTSAIIDRIRATDRRPRSALPGARR
ncbi:MAG TPA: D-glycero-beta-D-manno-heptose 1-phosphate adenylyltransferase [Kineosporiaceae bacterium]